MSTLSKMGAEIRKDVAFNYEYSLHETGSSNSFILVIRLLRRFSDCHFIKRPHTHSYHVSRSWQKISKKQHVHNSILIKNMKENTTFNWFCNRINEKIIRNTRRTSVRQYLTNTRYRSFLCKLIRGLPDLTNRNGA